MWFGEATRLNLDLAGVRVACCTVPMYPGPDLLQEVGRVTIAGARLDIRMGFLWHHLDRTKPDVQARRASGDAQCKAVRRLARERLVGPMRTQVLAAVDAAERARRRRNEIVHQDWLLRGPDGRRPVGEWLDLAPEDRESYIEDWERESKASEDWLRVPHDSIDVTPAQALEDLRQIERALTAAMNRVEQLTFRVASSRGTGSPRGYVGPLDWRDADSAHLLRGTSADE